MKRISRKKRIGLTAVLVILLAVLTVQGAMAYFTTYVTAKGGYQIRMHDQITEVEEKVSDWTKHVVVTNIGEDDCYVRVKAFAGSQFTLEYSGSGWTAGDDGYWYYDEILPVGGDSAPLDIKIHVPDQIVTDFDVVVVQECTPVIYHDGQPSADWDSVYTPDSEEASE